MKTSFYKHIIGQLSAGYTQDVLIQEIHRLSATGLTRQELINCMNYVHSCFTPGDPYRSTVAAVLDGLHGWCLPQQEILGDEPLNQLAVFEWADPQKWESEFDYIPWDHIVHPEDIRMVTTRFRSEIFYIGKTVNGFTWIKQFERALRVRKEYVRTIGYEGLFLDDKVKSAEGSEIVAFREALVQGMQFDSENNRIAYLLKMPGNKQADNPYYADELQVLYLPD